MKVMIAAMPWANPEVPSIQLGVLKKYLMDRDIPAEAGHWYLDVALDLGFDAYADISTPEVNAAEPLYSYLQFPEMRTFLLGNKAILARAGKIEKALSKSAHNPKVKFRWDAGFFEEFEATHRQILDRYLWEDYALVGFTLNYGQTVASLFMAAEIKKRNPLCKIIVGGAEASGELGASLIQHFPQLDYACNGEGEIPLYELSKAILEGASEDEIRDIRGITCREADGGIRINAPQQVESLDELEAPDYEEYFEDLRRRDIDPQSVIRELPVEGSRGCPFACNFCGLNLQWENFRSKSPKRIGDEIRALSQKYYVLGFRFMDNILPKNSEAIFEEIAAHGVHYRFFYEIRAQTPPRVLRLMKKAGASLIQCGVEAFSTSLLKRFNKKSKFINNLQAMKLCEELEIESGNNLILDYPGSTEKEVEETLRNVDLCSAYQPVNVGFYFLNVGSPDYRNAAQRGFTAIKNAEIYRYIFPEDLFKKLNLITKDFRSPVKTPKWRRVLKAVDVWRKNYVEGKRKLTNGRKFLLSYSDGGNFLQIEDARGRADGTCTLHHLNEEQRAVYLFADEIRPWNAFRESFDMEEADLKSLLGYFVENKLMYEEDGHYLSLAVNPEARHAREAAVPTHDRKEGNASVSSIG